MANSLLQHAVHRAARQREVNSGATSPTFSSDPKKSGLSPPTSDGEDDNTITTVHTPSQTPGVSRAPSRVQSRSSSPNRTASPGGGGAKLSSKARRELALKEKRSSLDPLRRFPNAVSARIFELLGMGADGLGGEAGDLSGVRTLLVCGGVCGKWRRSATINYIWYRLCNATVFTTSDPLPIFTPPTWTRKDSTRDWAAHYRSINRRDDLEIFDADEAEFVASGTMTPREEREARWKSEAEAEQESMTKNEMRKAYKELGGRKVRGKTGKGSGRDRTGWEDSGSFDAGF